MPISLKKIWKWSLKYDFCSQCWTNEKPHQWLWLCERCYDKKRDKKTNRKATKKKSQEKRYQKAKHTKAYLEYKNKKALEYYHKWKEALCLIRKTNRMLQNWLPLMTLIIKWKTYYLPFTTLTRPTSHDPNYDENLKQHKQDLKNFDILREFYKRR